MNREETKKAIEVMQAFVDGKEIEVACVGQTIWDEADSPCWDFYSYNYRVKVREIIDDQE